MESGKQCFGGARHGQWRQVSLDQKQRSEPLFPNFRISLGGGRRNHMGRESIILCILYTRLTALFPGLPRWAGTRKVKSIWILLKQETVSGSGISWAVCKSAPRSRQITTPTPHHSSCRMPFLPPNQQRQSTEGNM